MDGVLRVVVLALVVVLLVPMVAMAAPVAPETQTYTWGGYWAIDYGPGVNKWIDSSLKVFKSNTTVVQLKPAEWSTASGWTAQRILLMGKHDTITWAGGTDSAAAVVSNPGFQAWAQGRRFSAVMVQDSFDPTYFQVTKVVFE